MNETRMLNLVSQLAEAKSKQNVKKALKVCHPDMLLETPAINSVVRGSKENEIALNIFFNAFPDYEVSLDRYIVGQDRMVCWGTAKMTMTGNRFGIVPSGNQATLPVIIEFGFKDDLISYECFNYDLSNLCAQSGVSTDAVRTKIFGEPWVSDAA